MKINFLEREKTQNRCWFIIDGQYFCIAEEKGSLVLLDCEGNLIDEKSDHCRIKDAILQHYLGKKEENSKINLQ